MTIGEKIKALREEKHLTLEEVGNIVGVGKSTVRKWETGMIANMKRDKIASLAHALGVTPSFLMGWDESSALDSSAPSLRLDESAILHDYNLLNGTGKTKAKEYVADLVDNPKYTTPDESIEKEQSSSRSEAG